MLATAKFLAATANEYLSLYCKFERLWPRKASAARRRGEKSCSALRMATLLERARAVARRSPLRIQLSVSPQVAARHSLRQGEPLMSGPQCGASSTRSSVPPLPMRASMQLKILTNEFCFQPFLSSLGKQQSAPATGDFDWSPARWS